MALTALLQFGDNNIKRYSKEYLVSDCRFSFERPFNAFSPEGAAYCERVEVEVVAPGKSDLTLFDWFTSRGTQTGRILINLSNDQADDTNVQYLYFEDARCFHLSEFYDITTKRRRLLRLSIMAENIQIDDITYKRL